VRWCGVLEGFYGAPFAQHDRVELVQWAGSRGLTDYVYAPKGDAFLRGRWREPHPGATAVTDLVAVGAESGVRVAVVVSPGLDWSGVDDITPLVAKLRWCYDLGVRALGVAWDDVPRGGAALGAAHGVAVAAAVASLPDDVQWATCPTDYAVARPTAYLKAFAHEVPAEVDLMWTGPAIVSPTVTLEDVESLSAALGHRLVLADNVPVNDGPMAGVLHLGPYPARDPRVVDATGGVLFNLMPLPRASRVMVEAGARWWADPSSDRDASWQAAVAGVPGLSPLARAARSWLTDPGPDADLLTWADAAVDDDADTRLLDWLAAGCRADLAADWQAELEPWLQGWEWSAFVIAFALHAVRARPGDRVSATLAVTEAWRRYRALEPQLFGIRYAGYPVTCQVGDEVWPDRAGTVVGESLVDRVCRQVLDRLYGAAS
jgi:hypothetical protein